MGRVAVILFCLQFLESKRRRTGYAGINEQYALTVFEVDSVLDLQLEVS